MNRQEHTTVVVEDSKSEDKKSGDKKSVNKKQENPEDNKQEQEKEPEPKIIKLIKHENSKVAEPKITTTNHVDNITKIEVSPNNKYLVTYSEDDHSFIGWDIKTTDTTDGKQLKLDKLVPDGTSLKINDKIKVEQICVSDHKKLAYIYVYQGWHCLNIIDMENVNKKMEVYFNRGLYSNYCTFNEHNEFILYGNIYKHGNIEKLDGYLWIYNTTNELVRSRKINTLDLDEPVVDPPKNENTSQPKDGKETKHIWTCKNLHKIPKEFELVSITREDKLYLLSDNSIYEWHIDTGRLVGSIFINEKDKLKKKDIKDIKIASNEYFICLRFRDQIMIYSIELDIPIASYDIQYDGEEINKIIDHPGLSSMLPHLTSLFEEICWKESLEHSNSSLSSEGKPVIRTTSDYVFGILDKCVCKSKLVDKIDFSKYAKKIEPSKDGEQPKNDGEKKKNDGEQPKNDGEKKKNEPLDDAVAKIIEEFIKIKEEESSKDENNKENVKETKDTELNVNLFCPPDDSGHRDKFDHSELTNFIYYRVFEISNVNDKDDNKDKVQQPPSKISVNDKIAKECIYIEVPKDVLLDILSKDVKSQNKLEADKKDFGAITSSKLDYSDYMSAQKEGANTLDYSKYVYIKVPTNAPMDDRLEKHGDDHHDDKHVDDHHDHDDKQEKYAAKESIYIKISKTALENKTEKNNEVRIKIVQTFERDDYSNKWELRSTGIGVDELNKYKLQQLKNEKRISRNFDNGNFESAEIPIDIVEIKNGELEKENLDVLNANNKWNLICTEIEKLNKGSILGIKSFDPNNIVVLTKIGLFTYYFNDITKSMSLNYYYFMDYKHIVKYYKEVTKKHLPLPNHESFRFKGWQDRLLDSKESFLKYGVELLTFAIKEHDLGLIEDIYKKCIDSFKHDGNNRMFLSIITSTMPVFNEYYPDYINKYSVDTNMIIDSSFKNKEGVQECLVLTERRNKNLHLHAFSQSPLIENLTPSILWTKYNYKFQDPNASMAFNMLMVLQFIIIPITLPLYFITYTIFYLLARFHFINDIYRCDALALIYYYIYDKLTKKSEQVVTPTITFMVPYVKFFNYPKDYDWIKDWLKPQPSPFAETICNDIYNTWNGEAILNFKWHTFGKYYYYAIWFVFTATVACFSIAATPQHFVSKEGDDSTFHVRFINEDLRNRLLYATIALTFIQITFEIRQFFYDPIKWVSDPWNWFDITAYVLPIVTSIRWIKSINDEDGEGEPALIAFSCLFLDLKFLLFLRGLDYFGVYFAIIINVAKNIAAFLMLLLIIVIGFAHGFFILLAPTPTEDTISFSEPPENIGKLDDFNPWNTPDRYLTFINDNQVPSQMMMAQPDQNTNMFVDYRTSLLGMYFFLTGDASAVSNWTYLDHPELTIMFFMFSFLIVVYLMNLFIGLLSNEIEKSNNRVAFLIQKADILAEIELFYLFPHQRRWKEWFPEVLYFYASFDKTRNKVKELLENGEWDDDEFGDRKQALIKALKVKKDDEGFIIHKNS